jgi:hypothetical protein
MLLEWPSKVDRNYVANGIVSGLDLPVTFRNIFKSENPNAANWLSNSALRDGISLFPSFFNSPSSWDRPKPLGICQPMTVENPQFCSTFAILSQRWRLVATRQRTKSKTEYSVVNMKLFDINNDPREENNVAATNIDVFNELKEVGIRWINNITDSFLENCPKLVAKIPMKKGSHV